MSNCCYRNCIGQNFAMNEIKVALSQILRNFKLYLDEETPEPKMELRLILQTENGILNEMFCIVTQCRGQSGAEA